MNTTNGRRKMNITNWRGTGCPIIVLAILLAPLILLADSFTGKLTVLPQWKHSKVVGVSTVTETFAPFYQWNHTTGTSTNQMNVVVRETGILTNLQYRTVDLTTVTNSFGALSNFTTVRFLCITCPSSNLGEITIGADGPSAFSSWCGDTNQVVKIRPGGCWLMVAPDHTGYTIGGGLLRISNTGNSTNEYFLYIGGSE